MVGHKQSRAPDRDLILGSHRFPGEYIVKAFGPGSEEFREGIHASAIAVVGEARVTASERQTRTGRRMCVTLTVHANTVDEVIEIYDRIGEVPELMMLL